MSACGYKTAAAVPAGPRDHPDVPHAPAATAAVATEPLREDTVLFRIGFGYDVHGLTADRPLILGGVHVPHPFGLDGHSDADVLVHAVMDAVVGALGKGDIGRALSGYGSRNTREYPAWLY